MSHQVLIAAALLALTLSVSKSARSHEPTSGDPIVAHGIEELPAGMVLPQAEGPRPWSNKPVLNDPDRFQIAIVTDRTGGHRPGIWMEAMSKLNMLRPEFVVSVGDLIEGYTEDRQRLEREWAEFLGFVDKLDMRFFFVPGNHDVHNSVQHNLWREKFGDEWYSFDYKGVHFLCLCSEDPESRIGDEQLRWIETDLAKNTEARWTLVFLHKPLWTNSERAVAAGNPDRTNWKKVESLLADRPHTVFAGHVHNYVQYQRNGGRQYYSLATTGGGSRLRGEPYGEFDHVMWLTMEADGPSLAVLKLDGIRSPGVVTEASANRFRQFLRQARLEVAPILLDNESGFGQGDINLRLTNDFGEDVKVTARIEGLPLKGLTVEPARISLQASANESAEHGVRVSFAEKIDFLRLGQTSLTATISTQGANPLRAERVLPVVIDRRHVCPIVAQRPAIDGVAEPWPKAFYTTSKNPELLGDSAAWNGPDDGSFAFHTAHDDDYLYFAFRVTDERVVAGDRIELFLDGRTVVAQRNAPEFDWQANRVSVAAPVAAGEGAATNDYATWSGRRRRPIEGAKYAATRTDTGYMVEVALPSSVVTDHQGPDWYSYQLAVVQHDLDEPKGEETRILWRGSRDVERSNRGYGYFVNTPE